MMLCPEHFDAYEAGDRWVLDMGQSTPPLLMGSDLPRSLNGWGWREGHLSSDSGTALMRFELAGPDGTPSDIDFEMTAEQANGLAEAMRLRWG